MADSASSPAILEPNQQNSESGAPYALQNQPDPVPAYAPPSSTQSQSSTPSSTPVAANPNSNPSLASTPLPPPPPPTISYAAAAGPPQVSGVAAVLPPSMPSFRPLPPQAPQFSPLPTPGGAPNLNYQNPAVPPPGVVASTAGSVPVSVPQMQPMMSYQVAPGQPANPALRPFAPMPNGYAAVPAGPQGTMPPAVS